MFKVVAIGGTFDYLHKGHRYFITRAFQYGERVIIGLTSDKYVQENKNQKTKIMLKSQNYEKRKKELEEFLGREKLLTRAEIVKIDDIYGPAVKDLRIEALVVTSDTQEGARKINEKRKTSGLLPLKILQVPLVLAEDRKRIASVRIKLGEIDRWGKRYLWHFKWRLWQIDEELRQELKKPQGELIRGSLDNHFAVVEELENRFRKIQPVIVSTVGDEVTKLVNQIDWKPNLAIIDFRVQRKKIYCSLADLHFEAGKNAQNLFDLSIVRNPSGHIALTLVKKIAVAFQKIISTGKSQIIRVKGEEDLAGVPAILFAPLGSVVLYGQPKEGIVLVEVTEERKKQIFALIEKNVELGKR